VDKETDDSRAQGWRGGGQLLRSQAEGNIKLGGISLDDHGGPVVQARQKQEIGNPAKNARSGGEKNRQYPGKIPEE